MGSVIDRAAVNETAVEMYPLLSPEDSMRLIDQVLADVHGLGLLEPLLHDDTISDVMVVGDKGVWIERGGVITEVDVKITSTELEPLIERIVAPLGLRVDRSSPMVDARLADGSRVNVVLPPLAVDGPCLTVRRFGARPVELASVTDSHVASMLQRAVHDRMNILVSGGTGAGKTTLLNALATSIDERERVVTIEETAELRIPHRHVVRLEARSANSEGVGTVTLRDLVRNSLRMRPDRIIVGEVRGPEALDMLQAMNTGHEGSMSTCHANNPLDALRRLETMVLMAGVGLTLSAVRQHVAAAVDLIVQIARFRNGERRIIDVSEVVDGDSPSVRQLASGRGLTAVPRRAKRAECE